MPSYDFDVDLQAIVKAAQGTADSIKLFKDKDVHDLVPSEDDLGNGTIWGAVDEFQERWEMGMNNLTGDVGEIAGRLGKIAMNYAEFDKEGHATLTSAGADLASLTIMEP
ncbi:hypothetical protein [Aeromicrobium sp.]|uniref:hypothetical protein n=1 Tax=Aeromicrobium sp. TaxID=1871063 RepID=UPI0019B98A8D|nr:hypothetical protein [Aeromicrobium sp.]MBC7633921.1 hypothetical protein [Aeromicrobium sp.]